MQTCLNKHHQGPMDIPEAMLGYKQLPSTLELPTAIMCNTYVQLFVQLFMPSLTDGHYMHACLHHIFITQFAKFLQGLKASEVLSCQ